jgi:hypothetical protein
MGLSSTVAAGPRQRSHSQVRVPRGSLPHFTFSHSKLPKLEGQVTAFISPRNRFMNRSSLHGSSYSLSVTIENVCCLPVVAEKYLPNRCLSMDFRVCLLLRKRMFGERLSSNGLPLWFHYSCFQASCHNIIK